MKVIVFHNRVSRSRDTLGKGLEWVQISLKQGLHVHMVVISLESGLGVYSARVIVLLIL